MDPASVPLTFFRKASASINGPFGDIVKPAHVRLLDYEVEIGLVIGRAIPVGTAISDANLAEFIAGLVVTNDVSARDIQLPQTQFYEAKSYPTFTPVGPELVLLNAAGAQAIRRPAAAPERQRQRTAERAGRGRHAVPAVAGAAVAHPISGARPRRPDTHRYPGRHRPECTAEAGGDHRKPVATRGQVAGVLQAAGRPTRNICNTATSWRRRWPPTTGQSTSEPSATQSDTHDGRGFWRSRPRAGGHRRRRAHRHHRRHTVGSVRRAEPHPGPLAGRVSAAARRAPGRRDLPHHRAARHRRRVRRDIAAHARSAPAGQPIQGACRVQPRPLPQRARLPAGQHVRPTGIRGAAARKPQALSRTLNCAATPRSPRSPTTKDTCASPSPTAPTAGFTTSTRTMCWDATAPTAWFAPRSVQPCGI